MTAGPVTLNATSALIELANGTIPVYGTDARQDLGGIPVLWPGDVSHNGEILYTGIDNDRDKVLQSIGGVTPTNTTSGYLVEDANMDGVVRYTGTDNDRDIVLVSIGGAIPTNARAAQLP